VKGGQRAKLDRFISTKRSREKEHSRALFRGGTASGQKKLPRGRMSTTRKETRGRFGVLDKKVKILNSFRLQKHLDAKQVIKLLREKSSCVRRSSGVKGSSAAPGKG